MARKIQAPKPVDLSRRAATWSSSLFVGGIGWAAGTMMPSDLSDGAWWFIGAFGLVAAGLAAWGHRLPRGNLAVIAGPLLSLPMFWQGYVKATAADQFMKYKICAEPFQDETTGRITDFVFNIELINDNDRGKWVVREENPSLSFADVAAKLGDVKPFKVMKRSTHVYDVAIKYEVPPFPGGKREAGLYRFIFKYGRDANHTSKTLPVSGEVSVDFSEDASMRSKTRFKPDTASSADLVDYCDIQENDRAQKAQKLGG